MKRFEQFDIMIGKIKKGLAAFDFGLVHADATDERFRAMRQGRHGQALERFDGR
ncbi:MAG: hypothetical protein ACOYXU_13305 [Nitrospirota bacterium]